MTSGELAATAAGPAEPERRAATVSLDGLKVAFASREILHGISCVFPGGAVSALIGPTGCGKTTLLRTLNRLNEMSPTFRLEGRAMLNGVDIYRDFRDVRELRRRVGMLFQRPNPFPQSIEENVAIGLRAHKLVPRRQIREAVEQQLREVGLWEAVQDKLKASPFQLSGGQQQLLCLARTLAVDPEVILLDEPTSSLDPISTQRVEDLLTELKKRVTIIIVTHNLQQASRIADFVTFLHAGDLIETGPASEVFVTPKQSLTEDYITGRMG